MSPTETEVRVSRAMSRAKYKLRIEEVQAAEFWLDSLFSTLRGNFVTAAVRVHAALNVESRMDITVAAAEGPVAFAAKLREEAKRYPGDDVQGALLKAADAIQEMDPRPQLCQAIVDDHDHPAVYAPMQRMVTPGDKPCSRRRKERVGHLHLCSIHAKLAREGLVSETGRVAARTDINNVRRFPKRFPTGIHTWAQGVK